MRLTQSLGVQECRVRAAASEGGSLAAQRLGWLEADCLSAAPGSAPHALPSAELRVQNRPLHIFLPPAGQPLLSPIGTDNRASYIHWPDSLISCLTL